ncbi:hypothetical protein [Luteolibacter soli]
MMLTTITATAWMECHLNKSPVPFASAWVAGRPGHPARKLVLPAVGSVAFYGYVAVLFWIAADPGPESERSAGWAVAWGSAAVMATLLYRYLKAKLPE